MVEYKFENAELEKAYEKRVAELHKIADEKVDDTQYLWDQTVARYAVTMEKVKRLAETKDMTDYVASNMIRKMDQFLERCKEEEFHIALVGTIKAGKSTLINALLGYEYASTQVTPETAALTKFRKGEENYVKVSFYTEKEWNKLWQNAQDSKADVFLEEYRTLKADEEKANWLGKEPQKFACEDKDELKKEIGKWTSSKSSTHYFVKEVEVGLKEFELPDGVVLVDTPGLDDVVEFRSNITREYIDRANAVLVCVKSDTLTGPEMATIYSVFSNTCQHPEKVYTIATQMDTLNRPDKDWEKQRAEWIKYLKGQGAYGNRKLAEEKIIPVSARLYTLLKKYEQQIIDKEDDDYWELKGTLPKLRIEMSELDENYERVENFTNIPLFQKRLKSEIIANYKDMLVQDIADQYAMLCDDIKETMGRLKGEQEQIIKTSRGGMEEIRKKQQEYEAKYQEARKDRASLDGLLKTLRDYTKQRADELEKEIRDLGDE